MKTLSIFVVFMFLLSTMSVIAQDATTENVETLPAEAVSTEGVTADVLGYSVETTEPNLITGEAIAADPMVTNAEEAAAVSDAPLETATETPVTTADTEETTVQVGKEYSTLDSVLDRIRLAFTFQEERKVALMNKIEQKREQHYSFLVAKGKTEQADKFKAKTIGLVKNFEQWKEKKAAKLANVAEKAVKKLENKAEAVEQRVQERTAEMNAGEEQQIMQQNQENVNAEAGSDSGFKGGNK